MNLLGFRDKQISLILSLGDIAKDKRIPFCMNVTRKSQVSDILLLGCFVCSSSLVQVTGD